tara:strand:- start:114 stop:320 length:207 start_codon:yes stop_codon:yes gene_type:complete
MAETWVQFATKYYYEQKKKNPDYKFKAALKDAAPLYKNNDKTVEKNKKPVKEKKSTKKSKNGTRSKKN